ncbi:MAG: gliding motility-associated C-terminal domain-containing protein [Bacteroidetes bacterium]|nr:gliding motility-associated C-terminal domain-containing protein [Bacteroidota bacterium]
MKKLNLPGLIIALVMVLYTSLSFAQCNCTTGCTMVIDSVYNGNLTIMPFDKVCITKNGFVNGNITVNLDGKLCNSGKIFGELTFESVSCNGCGDENRLCNEGEIYMKKITPGVHVRLSNYGVFKACGDIPGPKSFTLDNYPGACLDVKGKYSVTPGTSSSSLWDGNVTIGSFDIMGGGNTLLTIKGSVLIKGSFKSSGSTGIAMKKGSCMETKAFEQASSTPFIIDSSSTLTTTTLLIGSGGLKTGNKTCIKATAITNNGTFDIGSNSSVTASSINMATIINVGTNSSLLVSGNIVITGSGSINMSSPSLLTANNIDLQAAAKLNGPTSGSADINIGNDLTWCCGTAILGNLDMCISNDPLKKKVTVGGQIVGPNVTWCANNTFTPQPCSVTCPPHVECSWSCCLALNLTGTHVNSTCGQSNGSVTISHTGGTAPYTYQWNDGATTKDRTGLSAGSYWVTVLDKDSCMGIFPLNILEPCGPTVTATGAKICLGACASVTATPSGPGTPPYTYAWSDGKTGAGPHSFCPVATTPYTVTLTDAGGMTATDTVIVTINPLMGLTTTAVNISCNGGSNGSANVAVTGGTPGFTYAWAALGGTGATTTGNLGVGSYTVTVTDSKGCTKTATAAITEPPPVTGVPSSTPANCGTNSGTASVVGGGGTGPYTYAWAPGAGTGATISNLAAGTYTVTVRDSKNCTTTTTALVTSTGGVTATITSSTNATCITNGSAVVSTTGGTAPFDILWSPGGGTGTTAGNLTAGTYTVVVTDANNCISSTTVTITVPAGPQLTTGKVDDNCGKGIGSTTVTVTSGTAPYTYLWNPGGMTLPNATGLFANTYTVSVTDANGCTATSTAVVANLNGPTATATSANITCFGAANGTAQASSTGGAAPYTYSWQPSGSSVSSLSGLSAGTYIITVTDVAGCTSTSSVTITEPPPITISTAVTPANCNTANGSILVTPGGGVGLLTATWAPAGGPGYTASNLAAGSYTVTITDATSCTSTSTVLVGNVGAPDIAVNQTNILCKGGNNGSATISVTGGTPGYSISWTPASAGSGTSITSLIAGSYTVVVTDANSCQQNTVVVITEPPVLTAVANSVSPLCPGNGSTNVTASGGTPGYTYNWMPGGAASPTVTGLGGGVYTVTVTDVNGCTVVSTASITTPPAIVASISPVDGTCGLNNGSASVTASGGTPGYSYNWAPSGGNGPTAGGLGANTYTVTVTDSKGCTQTTTAVVGNSPPVALAASVTTNVSCAGGNDGSATAAVGGGTAPIAYTWSPIGGTGTAATGLAAGSYTVNAVDSRGCTAVSNVTISEPPPLILSVTPPNKICIGQSATLSASASGGTAAYSYIWMPGPQSGATINVNPVVTTTYTVTVIDSKGCTTSSAITVDVTPPLQVDAGINQKVCSGGSTTATAVATGGDGNYTYTWLPSNSIGATLNVTPTGSQTYTVVVSDGCGTPPVTDVVIIQGVDPVLTPGFSPDSTMGCAPLSVSFNNTTTGGTTQGCSWDFGDGTTSSDCSPIHVFTRPGFYTIKLTVTDSNGCSTSLTKTKSVKVYPLPIAGFTIDPKSTSILTPTINFADKSSLDVVKWDWSFGDVYNSSSTKKNPTHTYKDTGRYEIQLIVTTQYGCKDTAIDYVIIHGDYTFYVPNAFSPNGDGKNETFFPTGFMINPECFGMMIFDRWGNLIFETDDLNRGWDGRANGGKDIAQQDVYVWKIQTCDYMKHSWSYIGHVTLVK